MNPSPTPTFVRNDETLDIEGVLKHYPWLTAKNQDCIISPDSDGLLCGLLMSFLFGWNIRGFYDGKVLLVEGGIKPGDCVFLDMEVFRRGVRSIGQHMIHYNHAKRPAHWEELDECISANGLRGFDVKNNFSKKYPLGTIHLLISLLSYARPIKIPLSGVSPLFYTDGTFKNLFNYPENCLSWFDFLHITEKNNPLNSIFISKPPTSLELMRAMRDFFDEISVIGNGRRGGDKIALSNKSGELVNIVEKEGLVAIEETPKNQAENFLLALSKRLEWSYDPKKWSWKNLKASRFTKGSISPSLGRYMDLMEKRPLSLAVTSMLSLEYTLDPENKF